MREFKHPLKCSRCNLDYSATVDDMHIYVCDMCETCYSDCASHLNSSIRLGSSADGSTRTRSPRLVGGASNVGICSQDDVFSAPTANETYAQIREILSVLVLQNEKIHEKLEKAEIENQKISKMIKEIAKVTLTTSFYNECVPSDDDDESDTTCEQVDHSVRSVGSSELKVVVTRCSHHGGVGRFYQVN
jgi:hypothetical protein